MGAPYLMLKRKKTSAEAGREESMPRLRTSAEISAAALDAYWEKLTASGPAGEYRVPELPPSRLLQNWRWSFREHWKQALITSLCYLLTFLLWRSLA